MRLLLFLDIDRRMIVGGLNDPSPATLPPLMQGDDVDVVLQGLRKNDDTAAQYYSAVAIPFAAIKAGISKGPDVPPDDGTICMKLVGGDPVHDVTPAFAPMIPKVDVPDGAGGMTAGLQTLLNALPGVGAKGGVRVLTKNKATNIFQIVWNNKAETALFDFTANELDPPSDTRSTVATLAGGQLQALKFRQLPLAFTDLFALPVEADVTTASVRTGTGTRNCIQSITVPRGVTGTVSFTFLTLSTAILSADGLTATVIANALNDLYSDSQTRFAVTAPSVGVLYVEFVGPLAKTNGALITAEMHDQAPVEQPTAKLPLDGPSLELAFDGAEKLALIFELEITDADGEVGTPVRAAVTVINDIIDGGMALAHTPPWLDPNNPVYVPPGSDEPAIVAPGGYVVTVGTTAGDLNYIITHDLGTLDVLVEVRENKANGLVVPDDQYTCLIVNDSQVKVTFPVAPAHDQYRVLIAAVQAQSRALPHHTHPISDVVDLQDALTHLQAEIDDITGVDGSGGGLPPIPESRLPGHIPWDNEAADGTFQSWRFKPIPDALIPANIPRLPLTVDELPDGVPFIGPDGGLYVTLPGPPPVTVEIVDPTGHVPVTALPTDLSTWAGLYDAILKVLQAGAPIPPGFVPMAINPLTETFPAAIVLREGTPAVAATLARSLPRAVNGGTVTGELPAPSLALAGQIFTVAGSASAAAARFRAAKLYENGTTLGCDGLQYFPVLLDSAGTAFPAEMERELFTLHVTPRMLQRNCRFACAAQVSLGMLGACAPTTRASYQLRVQFGTVAGQALSLVIFTGTALAETLILSSASVIHAFEVTVTRNPTSAQDGLTATAGMYGRTASITAPGAPDFVLRASLTHFDLEDTDTPPVGQIKVEMKSASASVVDLSQSNQ